MIKQLTLSRSGNNTTYGTLLQTSLIPMHALPSFMSPTILQATGSEGGSLRKIPHSLLSGYSLQEKLHTHMKYKSIPAGATYWAYKFSCKYMAYSCLPTCHIALNTNIIHNIDKEVTYNYFQDKS